ncbi:MAG TPA: alpha/beta hydrolase-fold protein [Steroidobacteraceae bacterium]
MQQRKKSRRGKGKGGLATQVSAQLEAQLQPQLQVDPALTEPPQPEAPAHPRLRFHAQFHSRYLTDDRDVTVYLPPGYDDEPGRHYPVLYLHDGQNLFDPRTSFIPGRTWQIAETADAVIEAGEVEPLIIVGIANAGERRLAEYTPTRDWKMGGGEANKYGDLLTQDLLPFIVSTYRVRGDVQNTGLGGSSLGGLVTLYLGLQYSDIFGRLSVMSPSVWWNHKSIVGYVNDAAPRLRRHPRIWLDVGDAEGRRTVADTELLERRLEAGGWKPKHDLHYERVPGGTHDEAAWAQRVAPMLRFLFPAGQR